MVSCRVRAPKARVLILARILHRLLYTIRIQCMRVFRPALNTHGLASTLLLMVFVLPAYAGTGSTTEPIPPAATAERSSEIPGDAELEASGVLIGNITFDRQNVFDTTQPAENKALYRLANRWHIVTRQSVILAQLLFRQGDPYSRRILDESERLLRGNNYIYDAKITPVRYADGTVDILVWTRDVWTIAPELSFSRTGGENKTRIALSEKNLFGRGTTIRVSREDNVDRVTTRLAFFDNNIFKSRTSLFLNLSNSSDGNTQQIRVQRPFFALDTRWAVGGSLRNDDLEERVYDLGNTVAEYRQEINRHVLFGGLSTGLKNGWVRRWTAGMVYDINQFSPVVDGTLAELLPEDRRLIYPFIGFELLEDEFQTAANRDQMERTEDFYFGTRFTAGLGYASKSFDADRDALIYSLGASKGFGSMEKKATLLASTMSGRVDGGNADNTRINLSARYYSHQSKQWLFFAAMSGSWGKDLDLDNYLQLGGDNGLRGYPLRYQTGSARLLISIEERYFTHWYPFRLFRVGFAAFVDAGRTWGDNPAAGPPLGWLRNVGIGLRIVPTRASGREIYHLDLAFPLDGDPSIDGVQILLQTKTNF